MPTTSTAASPAPAPEAPDDPPCAESGEESDVVKYNNFEYGNLDDLDLPPLRINATKMRDRMSASCLHIPPGLVHSQMSKRNSLDSKLSSVSGNSSSSGLQMMGGRRSRSRSPSLKDKATVTTLDGNSSFSSLEEFVDLDILYDKMGFGELDLKEQKQQLIHSNNLTPVSERMSEDTLEDVHAFSDLSANTNTRPSSSAGGSTVGGEVSSHVLAPLDEIDEDIDSDQEQTEGQIIVTNMENVTLQDVDAEHQETPSLPTS